MLAKILSAAVVGLEAAQVTVEVDIASQGLPSFTLVGLPDKAVEESKERVRSALKNSGAEFPAKRITVNLAPADLPKVGPSYDLPIALGILIASGQLQMKEQNFIVWGELSLDGSVRHTNGVLSVALLAKQLRCALFLPSIDAKEASVLEHIEIYPVPSLLSLFHHFRGTTPLEPKEHVPFDTSILPSSYDVDMRDIHGQENAKRALEIAAAGSHNVFMSGLPGAGKTMLARSMSSILPYLTEKEALEVTRIYSVTGNLPQGECIIRHRPFRAPHHTTSRIGLIGGGTHPTPGEISLAHRGVLFLDEFPEFPRHIIESLRQPIEDGIVTISRAAGTVSYPAKFMLIGASNPCPCGYLGSLIKRCSCSPGQITRYRKRISGPILDRIDLHIIVPSVDINKLTQVSATGETSETIRMRVQQARNIQLQRYKKLNILSNAELSTRMIRELCPLTSEALSLLKRAILQMGLSARSYYRVIKISRTIADLENSTDISMPHVAEALRYRPQEVT